MQPKIIIIAGPHGAGKTTFAREFLPNEAACPVFVNADLITAGLTKPHHVNEPVPAYRSGTAAAKADMAGAQAAMHRAAQRARQIAQQTGTDLIVARAGHVVRISPGKFETK